MNGGAGQFGRVLRAVEREHADSARFGGRAHGNSRPVLGYPSMGAAAVALREQGLSYEEIAERLGCSPQSARVQIYKQTGKSTRPTKNVMPTVSQAVAAAIFDQAVEAGIRDLGARDIIRRLLHRIAERRMVEQLLKGSSL